MPNDQRTVVLVEGDSDRAAVLAAADVLGIDLSAANSHVLAMGGITNIRHYVTKLGPTGEGVRILGLCDTGEQRFVNRALGLPDNTDAKTLAQQGFFVCDADLEDELIRCVGPPAVQRIIEATGDVRSLRSMQQQPAQRDRDISAQLHRFFGAGSGRKIRYAPLLVAALGPATLPHPLRELLNATAGQR